VDLEYSGPLVRLERSVYILACSPSLEREQESLGVQLFDVGFAGCKEFVADAARGRSRFFRYFQFCLNVPVDRPFEVKVNEAKSRERHEERRSGRGP